MSNPILDFFKYADARVHVKAHVRRTDTGTTIVDAHDRTIDTDAEVLSAETGADDVLLNAKDALPDEVDKAGVDVLDVVDEEAELPVEEVDDTPLKVRVKLESISKNKYGPLTREQELEQWRKWKYGGKKAEDLEPLLQSFRPLLADRMKAYKGRVRLIPDSAIEAEFQLRFVEALDTYSPEKSALSTYVYRYLDKAKRFIAENQNIGRIPETRIYQIKKYQTAQADLAEELSRPPTPAELAKRLSWPVAEVERMDAELRNDLLSQGFEDDPYSHTPSKSEEVLKLFKYELSGSEREVYEYLTGYGKPKLDSTGAIAKAMNIPDYQVSRYKESIQKKIAKYVEE